jgi:hypothetical protein
LLYADLASVTTIAASNSIYQSTKAPMARKQQIKQVEMCAAEARSLKNKASMLDVFGASVAAVGIKNANGCKMLKRLRQEDRKAKVRFGKR